MAESKRQQIVDAVKNKLKTILTTGGYETDFGAKVFLWRQRPFEQSELPALILRDENEATEVRNLRPTGGTHEHNLALTVVGAVMKPETTDPEEISEELLKGIQDVTKAIGADLTWGGLAIDTVPGTNEKSMEMEQKIVGGFKMSFSIKYRTLAFNPVE